MAELQKKVKVLQQRHRRHLEKLLGLENTVSQLRQSNLLNEERLQLLERVRILKYFHEITPDLFKSETSNCYSQVSFSCRCFLMFHWEILNSEFLLMKMSPFFQAYIQTSAAVSDAGETVAIIYEEDDAAYLYTPLTNADEKL